MVEEAISDSELYELQASVTRVCTLSAEPCGRSDRPDVAALAAEALEQGAMYAVILMAVVAAERFDLIVQAAGREGALSAAEFPAEHLASVVTRPPGLDERDFQACLDLVVAVTTGPLDHQAVWSLVRSKAASAFLTLLAIADVLGVFALRADPSLGRSLRDLVAAEAMRRELAWWARGVRGDADGA